MYNLDVLLFTYLQKTHQVKDYTPKYTKKKKKNSKFNSKKTNDPIKKDSQRLFTNTSPKKIHRWLMSI